VDYSKLTLKQLAAEYNQLAAEVEKQTGDIIPTVNKFSNRDAGIRRTTELAAQLPKEKKKGSRGRPSAYSGHKLYPLCDTNPRYPGSHGYHAIKIIMDNPGITYEDYMAAGGLSNGLRYDLAHEFVRTEPNSARS
tara:strand:- start:7062 stop:7466 length:405 start_codon:yes stop_codon:yes gene_type:complete